MTSNSLVNQDLVIRSQVTKGLPYLSYKKYAREDFFYSCAYCTMSESEAQAVRFTLDHYEPVKARPDLKDDYENIMYCCDECNMRKGDRSPPIDARNKGFRFFRPDQDKFFEHFRSDGLHVRGLTPTGEYSTEALDLNRSTLQRLRDLRKRLTECDAFVARGINALKNFKIDQLPQHVKWQANIVRRRAIGAYGDLTNELEGILRRYAMSHLLDDGDEDLDTKAKDAKLRKSKLKQIEGMFPGTWRGRSV